MITHAATLHTEQWVIETRRFCARQGVIEGALVPAQLERLSLEVVEPFAPLSARVEAARSPRGVDGLLVKLDGVVKLQCQRCMDPVEISVATTARFEFVGSDGAQDANLDDDEWDAIRDSEHLELLPLIEDELLLAIPFAPMHDACEAAVQSDTGVRRNPFAALAEIAAKRRK